MKSPSTPTSKLQISRVTVSAGAVRTGLQAGTLFPPGVLLSRGCPPITQPG